MKPKISKEEHAALHEVLRAEYGENEDGYFSLNIATNEVGQLEEVTGLKSALASQRKQFREKDRELEALKQKLGGLDPDELRSQLEAATALSTTTKTEIDGLKSRLADAIANAEYARVIAEHKGNAKVLLPVLKTMTKVVGDKVVVSDDPDKSLTDLVAEMRADTQYGGLFYAAPASGSGTPASGGAGIGASSGVRNLSGIQRSKLSTLERAKLMKELGEARYLELPV